MTTYFSLPVEIRQIILTEAIAAAENEDYASHALLEFSALFRPSRAIRLIALFGQEPLSNSHEEGSQKDRCVPLEYLPKVASLIDDLVAAHDDLVAAHDDIRADLVYVVNKCYESQARRNEGGTDMIRADEKKKVDYKSFTGSRGALACAIPALWSSWVLGICMYSRSDPEADDDFERWRKTWYSEKYTVRTQLYTEDEPVNIWAIVRRWA